jgi:hypothetical protein
MHSEAMHHVIRPKINSSYALTNDASTPEGVIAKEKQKGNSKFKAKSDFGI